MQPSVQVVAVIAAHTVVEKPVLADESIWGK